MTLTAVPDEQTKWIRVVYVVITPSASHTDPLVYSNNSWSRSTITGPFLAMPKLLTSTFSDRPSCSINMYSTHTFVVSVAVLFHHVHSPLMFTVSVLTLPVSNFISQTEAFLSQPGTALRGRHTLM